MTIRIQITRALAGATATGLLALGLAACSSTSSDDPNAEAFCKASHEAEKVSSRVMSDDLDPDGAAAALQELLDAMDVEAPKDIAPEWNAIKEKFNTLNEAIKNMDTGSMESATEIQTAAQDLVSDEYKSAADKVDTWTKKNCK